MVGLLTETDIDQQQAEIFDEIEVIDSLCKEEDRSPSDDERKAVEDFHAKFDALEELRPQAKKREEIRSRMKNPRGEPTPQRLPATPKDEVDEQRFGFKNWKDMLRSVMDSTRKREMDNRLVPLIVDAAGADEQSTISDPYGGFLVPEIFMPDFLTVTPESDPTQSRVRTIPMQAKTITFPARTDKTHTSSATGGITVGRRTETQAAASSRMETEQVKLEASSLDALVYVSDELLADSPLSVLALIQTAVQDEFVVKRLQERIRGTGVGQMEGVLNSPSLVTVTRTTALSVDGIDLAEMRSRCKNYGNAIWILNHQCYETLAAATIAGEGGVAEQFLYNAGSTIPGTTENRSVDRPDMLMGRPIFWCEYASAIGNAGDVILADWSQFLYGVRVGGPQFASSMHVRFENHEQTLRFTERNDGRAWWRAPITPNQATTFTMSPFVTLSTKLS